MDLSRFVYLPVDGCLDFFYFLAFINHAEYYCTLFFEHVFIFLGKMANSMVGIHMPYKEIAVVFSKAPTLLYVPVSHM